MSLFTRDMVNNYSTLIFDLDGTVLDSMSVWGKVDEIFLGKRGLTVSKEYVDGIKIRSTYQGALFTIDMFGLDEKPEDIIAEWEAMVTNEYSSSIKLKDGVADFIKYAHDCGLKICLATASSRLNSTAALANNNVLEYFDCLITLDDFDTEISKKTPDIFLRAAREVGETDPSKCIVFEDVLSAVLGAKKGGFCTAIVFEQTNSADFEKAKEIADFEINGWKNV